MDNDKKSKEIVFPAMKNAIEELLSNKTLATEQIAAFQEQYWQKLVPNFSQALKLLDIHGVSRHNILWNINDRLLETIKSRIEAKSPENESKKSQRLWQKLTKTGMIYIHHPYIRPLVMQVLGKMTSIKDRHVKIIMDNDELYDDTPLPVLRHIWSSHPEKYKEELLKVLDPHKDIMLDGLVLCVCAVAAPVAFSAVDSTPSLYISPRKRRRVGVVSRLVEMIGERDNLYESVVNLIRDKFRESQEAAISQLNHQSLLRPLEEPCPSKKKKSSSKHSSTKLNFYSSSNFISTALEPNKAAICATFFCTLRVDILMALNEAKLEQLATKDPIHRIVWCLDACVRNRKIDQRHACELAAHLQRQRNKVHKRSQDEALEEIKQAKEAESLLKLDSNGKKSKKAAHDFEESLRYEKEQVTLLTRMKSRESILEQDMSMVSQEPWIVYVIVTSIIRNSMQGLYQDAIPRESAEIHFLVELLLIGLEQALTPPEGVEMPMFASDGEVHMPRCPREALLLHVLPAMCQLQVSSWRAQVAEDIRVTSHKIWPQLAPSSPPPKSPPPQQSRDEVPVPSKWRRKLDDFAPQPVVMPQTYLLHPAGLLVLQYHVLFAVERHDWSVLRALLKGIAQAVQKQNKAAAKMASSAESSATGLKRPRTVSESGGGSSMREGFPFRWRPECLQAVALGLSAEVDNELIHLLKATLNMQNEFHLAVLGHLSRLLPRGSSALSLGQLHALDASLSTVSEKVPTCDRDRYLNLLNKHAAAVSPGGRIQSLYEALKQELEQNVTPIGLLGNLDFKFPSTPSVPAAGSSNSEAVSIGKQGGSNGSRVMGPPSSLPRRHSSGSSGESSDQKSPPTPGSYFSYGEGPMSPKGFSRRVPGTPLLNPGFMAPTPAHSNSSMGANPYNPSSPRN